MSREMRHDFGEKDEVDLSQVSVSNAEQTTLDSFCFVLIFSSAESSSLCIGLIFDFSAMRSCSRGG